MHHARSTRAVIAVALTLASGAAATPASAATSVRSGLRPLFARGYDLCHAASLASVRRAGGERYEAGSFAVGICTWERRDLQAGLTLSTHSPTAGAMLMRSFLLRTGGRRGAARELAVPGAVKAVIVTLPTSNPTEVSKDLFASYRGGTIQVDITAPGFLRDSRLVAVMRLIARR